MEELWNHLVTYYHCSTLAETWQLTQPERFACNDTYQQIKRLFVGAELDQRLTAQQNLEAYQLFKSWESENASLVEYLRLRQ